mgnify:FL=1
MSFLKSPPPLFSQNSASASLLWFLFWLWSLRLCALATVFLFLGVYVPKTLMKTGHDRDVAIYYTALERLERNKPIYQPRPDYGPHSKPTQYLYLPPALAVITPLKTLEWLPFVRLWTLGLVAFFLGFAAILAWLATRRIEWWSFIYALAALWLFPGAARTFFLGQIEPILWFLFGLGIVQLVRGGAWAGLCFSLASVVKIYSFWAVLALPRSMWKRQWPIAALVWGVALILGGVVCGFDQYAKWFEAVPPVMRQGTFNADNYSLSMGVLRVAQWLGWEYASGPLSGLPKLWLSASVILGPLLMLWLTRNQTPALRCAVVGATASLFAPICWSIYLPALLCPLALWAYEKNLFAASTAPQNGGASEA